MIATLLAGLAAAAPARVLPGAALVAPPCTPDPAARCWADAPLAARFAAPPGVHHAPLEADVRVAWDAEGLLVRAEGLPAGARVEAGHVTSLAHGVERARPGVGADGVLRIPAGPPRAAVEGLFLAIALEDAGGDTVSLHWAPAGEADAIHPAGLVRAAAPSPGLPLDIEVSDHHLDVLAPGAGRVVLAAMDPVLPANPLPEPATWSTAGEDRVVNATPPDPGWIDVQAVWTDPAGAPLDLQRRRLWWAGPTPPEAAWDELHPAPKAVRPGQGSWSPGHGASVCAEPRFSAAAALLVEEVGRISGTALVAGEGRRCAVRFVDLDALPGALPEGERSHPQAFAVVVDRRGATLGVRDARTATWAALALADLLGTDGTAPALALLDWPDIDERPLYHSLNLRGRPDWSTADYARFVRRVVARGRYTTLYVAPWEAVPYPSRPELERRWTRPASDWQALFADARSLGITVAPATSGLGHAGWLIEAHPELRSDVQSEVLDLRLAETRALVRDVIDDLVSLFGDVDRLHIGHDEVMWRGTRLFGEERSPASSGTPHGILLADSLRWTLGVAAEKDLDVVVWSDMLLEGWHGGREGTHHALDLLTPPERARLTVAAWSRLGEPLAHLPPLGMPVMRVHTGYLDWKRRDLRAEAPLLVGEGLALFVAAPWAAVGPSVGSRHRAYHSSAVLLAGTTGWDTALADWSIGTVHAALADLPALRPGAEAAGPVGRPLVLDGAPPPPSGRPVAWPRQVTLDGVAWPLDARAAVAGSPVTVDPGGATRVALLLADDIDFPAAHRLFSDMRSDPDAARRAVAVARLHAANAPPVDVPLEHGLDLYAVDGGAWSAGQWRAAGSVALPSVAGLGAADRRLWRKDLARPDGLPLTRVEVIVERPGAVVLVGGAARVGE